MLKLITDLICKFSSIKIKQGYIDKHYQPDYTNIKVNIRTLDLVLEEAKLDQNIDILIIDTEGWELEVMRGFNHIKYNPKVVILENYLHDDLYTDVLTHTFMHTTYDLLLIASY